jgi:uncharacterized integral membrane protein
MKTLTTTITSLILAAWMGAAAILAVQNFTPVSFKFLTIQSIEIPFGVMLAFSAGLGAIGTTIVPLVFGSVPAPDDEE